MWVLSGWVSPVETRFPLHSTPIVRTVHSQFKCVWIILFATIQALRSGINSMITVKHGFQILLHSRFRRMTSWFADTEKQQCKITPATYIWCHSDHLTYIASHFLGPNYIWQWSGTLMVQYKSTYMHRIISFHSNRSMSLTGPRFHLVVIDHRLLTVEVVRSTWYEKDLRITIISLLAMTFTFAVNM